MKLLRRINEQLNCLTLLVFCGLLFMNGETVYGQSCTTIPISAGFSGNGVLADTDCNAPHRSVSKAKLYTFTGIAGQRATIAMNSSVLDSYLILVSPGGGIVNNPGADDDRGGNRNALISDLPLTSSGTYTIEATAYNPADRGAFTIALTLVNSGTDNAAFVADITIPDNTQMTPGQHFTKTWRLRNTGTTVWGSGYVLGFVSGPQMGAPSSVNAPSAVPNSTVDVSVPMIAPTPAGTYQGFWRMKNPSGQFFGTQIWVKIIVNSSGACATQSIAIGATVNGSLSDTDCNAPHRSGRKADQYTFSGTAGQRVTVSMNSTALDSYLILVGPSGSIVNDPVTDDDRGGSRNALISNLLLSSSGTYTIEATSYYATDRGAYSLSLALGSITCNPTAISSGATVNGNIAESDCNTPHRLTSKGDLYTFAASAGQHVTIAQRSTIIDSYLILVGPTGNIVNNPDGDDDAGGGRDALISDLSLPSSGTYTIEATAFNSFDRGSYTLTLTVSGGNCIPTSISAGSPVNGTLTEGDCNAPHRTNSKADLYRFSGTTGQRVTISMNSSAIDSYLILVGPSGSIVNNPDADDDRGGGRNALINNLSLPAPGTYTIEATAYHSSDRGTYIVTLTNGNQGGEPCLVFVHGSRVADATSGYDWSQDWLAGRNHWRSYIDVPGDLIDGSDTVSTNPADDFIRAATNNFSRPHFVVRYNGAAEWWNSEAAGQVASEIVRATNGEFDGPIGQADRSQCTTPWQNGGTFWVVAHSGGATVMDFILGNSRPTDPNFNFNGSYDQVASRITGVFSVAGAHRGSSLADTICNPGTGCNIAGHNCTNARRWLQTDESHQVYFYSSSPAKTVWLTGGYKGGPTSACLNGEDDAVLQYASIFACSGDANGSYNNSNVCGSNSKQESANFRNLDGVYENHDDIRNNRSSTRERRSIPDGIWECDGQQCAPNLVVRSNLSTASFVDLLLTEAFPSQPVVSKPFLGLQDGKGLLSKSLIEATTEGYRTLARYPRSSFPIEGTQDPILKKLVVSPRTVLGPGGDEPTLTVHPSEISFEAPENVVLNAYLSMKGKRLKAKSITGFIVNEHGEKTAVLEYHDDGKGGDVLSGDGIYTATFAPPRGQEREYKGIHSVRVQAITVEGEERVASTSFQYSAPDSHLTGKYEDQIVDGSLQILAQTEVTAKGRFHIEGTIYSKDGRPIAWAQNTLSLDVGIHHLPLTFYGLIIREKALDGPYVLKYLSLSTTTEMPNCKNRLAQNVYTTAKYNAADFTDQPFNEPGLLGNVTRGEGSQAVQKTSVGALQSGALKLTPSFKLGPVQILKPVTDEPIFVNRKMFKSRWIE